MIQLTETERIAKINKIFELFTFELKLDNLSNFTVTPLQTIFRNKDVKVSDIQKLSQDIDVSLNAQELLFLSTLQARDTLQKNSYYLIPILPGFKANYNLIFNRNGVFTTNNMNNYYAIVPRSVAISSLNSKYNIDNNFKITSNMEIGDDTVSGIKLYLPGNTNMNAQELINLHNKICELYQENYKKPCCNTNNVELTPSVFDYFSFGAEEE